MKQHKGGWRRMLTILLILALVAVLAYLAVVAMVCYKESHVPESGDYGAIVVLGAQVKADGTLSVQLKWRLDAAYDAWQRDPEDLIVTCGAQGSDEPAPEGLVMRDYLIGLGVPETQVLADVTSYNTRQNIQNAKALLAGTNVTGVLIVTSDYHLPRALALAQDEGLAATGLGSPTKPEFWVKNHAREALSWIKYWGQKYLHLPLE